jgi:uncharacterized membrane protein YhaH (DUF805 family)
MPSTHAFGRLGVRPAAAAPAPRGPAPPPPPGDTDGFDLRAFLFSFDGRIPRLWYWLGHLGLFIAIETVSQSVSLVTRMAKTGLDPAHHAPSPGLALGAAGGMLLLLVGLLAALGAFLWASAAITVKRWHDRDRSWVWALLGLVPVIGWVWQGIECGFLEGTLGPNRFGPSPKGIQGVVYAA